MTKWFALALVTLGLAACAPSTKKDSANETPQTVNETDLSVCQNGPQATKLDGRWEALARSGPLRFRVQLRFQGSRFDLDNTCSLIGGPSVTVRVTTMINRGPTSFMVLQDDQDRQSASDGSQQVNCSVEIKKSQAFSYRFNGSCLEMTHNAETQTFVPL